MADLVAPWKKHGVKRAKWLHQLSCQECNALMLWAAWRLEGLRT